MKNRKCFLLGCVTGILFWAMLFVGKWILMPSARQALPFFRPFTEELSEFGFKPDFHYKLEANMTAGEFDAFVRKMRFPESSRVRPHLYVIDLNNGQYQKRAEYDGGKVIFEESRQ